MGLFKTVMGSSSTCSQVNLRQTLERFLRSHQLEQPREQMTTKVFRAAIQIWIRIRCMWSDKGTTKFFRSDWGFNNRYKMSRECAEIIKRIIYMFVEFYSSQQQPSCTCPRQQNQFIDSRTENLQLPRCTYLQGQCSQPFYNKCSHAFNARNSFTAFLLPS